MAAIARSFLLTALVCSAQPADVIEFLRSTASVLASAHDTGPREFLDLFDPSMPEYSTFRNDVETLVTRAEVGSAISIVTDAGNEQRRTLELDWLLEIQDQAPRRKIVKVTIEKRGKTWKFTSLEPVDFFKY